MFKPDQGDLLGHHVTDLLRKCGSGETISIDDILPEDVDTTRAFEFADGKRSDGTTFPPRNGDQGDP